MEKSRPARRAPTPALLNGQVNTKRTKSEVGGRHIGGHVRRSRWCLQTPNAGKTLPTGPPKCRRPRRGSRRGGPSPAPRSPHCSEVGAHRSLHLVVFDRAHPRARTQATTRRCADSFLRASAFFPGILPATLTGGRRGDL